MVCPCIQAQPTVGIQINAGYAAISVSGTAGTAYELQFVNQPFASNNWLYSANLQLVGATQTYVDTSGVAATGQRFYRVVEIPNTNMVFVPAGTFTMGSPDTEEDRSAYEGPQTVVTLTKSFFIGKYNVTQGEYASLMNTNPSYFSGNLSLPVEQVTWWDATNYCATLTAQEQQAGRLPAGWRYRLPTEAEWEYACRAGTTTRFYYGDDLSYTNLANYAWYGNTAGTTHPVGQLLPNPWGLYNMGGNVWNWCLDTGIVYPGGSETDPIGPPGDNIAFRGGSFLSIAPLERSANRGFHPPQDSSYRIGFRVVLAPIPP